VTLVDISEEGLSLARARGVEAGCSLRTLTLDLAVQPLPEGPWDLLLCVAFLHRELFARAADLLLPDGWLVVVQATRTNLERNPRPSARFLLEDGELPTLIRGLEVVQYEEGWTAEGRHEARLAARRM